MGEVKKAIVDFHSMLGKDNVTLINELIVGEIESEIHHENPNGPEYMDRLLDLKDMFDPELL